jgi:nucleoside-diphosphate-sugar epimerase
MIFGPDLAQALVALAEDLAAGPRASAGRSFEIDDGAGGHTPADVAAAIGAALGKPVRPFPVNAALLRLAALGDTALARLKGALPRLSRDRAGYMTHRDWSAESAPLLALGIWRPETRLVEGMAATAAWYRAQGLL